MEFLGWTAVLATLDTYAMIAYVVVKVVIGALG